MSRYRKHGRMVLSLILAITVSGCVSIEFAGTDDEQPDASTNTSNYTGYQLPRDEILEKAGEVKSGEVVKINDKLMVMGDMYTSASGLQCRRVTILLGENKVETRLACMEGPDWCLTKRIITE